MVGREPDKNRFEAREVLPLGLSFPFDFGVECRVLGAFCVKTDDERNDRIVAVPTIALRGADWTDLNEIGGTWKNEICDFLRSYVEREGRRFELVKVVGHAEALQLVAKAR